MSYTMMCWRKTVMQGMTLQSLCAHMYVCTHRGRRGLRWGLQRGRPVACSSPDRGPGAWSTPVCPPSRKPACTSDVSHVKQHRVDLFYGAPTPDHTHGTAGEPP